MATFSPLSARSGGTGLADGVTFGNLPSLNQINSAFYINNGPVSRNGIITLAGSQGVYYTPSTSFSIIPVALAANGIATAQIPANAGYLTLANPVSLSTYLPGSTQTGVILDCQRGVTVTGNANTGAANVTLYGYDMYLQPVGETFAGPVGANTVTSGKTYAIITNVFVSAGTTANITVGTADRFGLPYYLPAPNQQVGNAPRAVDTNQTLINAAYWNNIPLNFTITNDGNGANATLTASNSIIGGDGRAAAANTTDVRGIINTGITGTASNGTIRLTCNYTIAAGVPPQSLALLNSNTVLANGSTANISYFGQPQFIPARQ